MAKAANQKEARQQLKDARAKLAKVCEGWEDHEETPEYQAANRAVLDAEQQVSWWRR